MTDFACRVGFALLDLVSSVTETLEHGPAASSVTDFACRVGFAPVIGFACRVKGLGLFTCRVVLFRVNVNVFQTRRYCCF